MTFLPVKAPIRDEPFQKQRPAISNANTRRRRLIVYGMNYSPEIAGVGRYTGEIAEHLVRENWDVTVITTPPHYPGWIIQPGYKNRYSEAVRDGLRILRVPLILRRKMRGAWRLIAPLSFALSSAPVVFWQIIRQRPETVFCVEPTLFAAPVAQLAAKLAGSKIVLHVQDLEVDAAFAVGHLRSKTWLKAIGHRFERATLLRFSKIVTISYRMAEKLTEKGVQPERLSVVRNWVDTSHIYPMETASPYRIELGFRDQDFVVMYSGNIGAKQGLNVLLKAAEYLKERPEIHFIIAGEGPEKAELQANYAHLDSVRFLPFQPYERLNEFLNMANLHVLTQEKGAADLVLPSKLGGMLACGKPIVATADHGTEIAEFLAGAAIISPPGDVGALAKAIESAYDNVLSDSQTRIAKARLLARDESIFALIRTISD